MSRAPTLHHGAGTVFHPARSSSGPRPPRTQQAPPSSHVHHLQQRFPSTPPVFSSAREGSHEERLLCGRKHTNAKEEGSTRQRREGMHRTLTMTRPFSPSCFQCAPHRSLRLAPATARMRARHLRILISRKKKKKSYDSGRTSNPRRAPSGCAAPCKPFLALSAHTPCSAAIASSLCSSRDHTPRLNGDALPSGTTCFHHRPTRTRQRPCSPLSCSVCLPVKETGGTLEAPVRTVP